MTLLLICVLDFTSSIYTRTIDNEYDNENRNWLVWVLQQEEELRHPKNKYWICLNSWFWESSHCRHCIGLLIGYYYLYIFIQFLAHPFASFNQMQETKPEFLLFYSTYPQPKHKMITFILLEKHKISSILPKNYTQFNVPFPNYDNHRLKILINSTT